MNLLKKRAITSFDIVIFLRQFATLISAGIPIIQCCSILEKSQEVKQLNVLIYTIKRELSAGKKLSAIFESYRQYFNPLICSLIKIGETTGQLDSMLLSIAAHQEKNLAFKRRIHQACFYPAILSITAFAITLGLFIFVVPKFAELFADSYNKLPTLTKALFYISSILNQFLLAFFILLIVGTIALILYFPILKKRLIKLTELIQYLPWINHCYKKILLLHFTRNLSITLGAGIPILDALTLSLPLFENTVFSPAIKQLQQRLTSGQHLHLAMSQSTLFPPFVVQMVKIGEESGMLEDMLAKIADFFASDIDLFIAKFSQVLEPLIMLVQGALIGGIVIGMYLPIFKLGNTF